MQRKAYAIKNAKGEWFHGKARWSAGWTSKFSEARLYETRRAAALSAGKGGLAGTPSYAQRRGFIPGDCPVVIELNVTEEPHDNPDRGRGDGQPASQDDAGLVSDDSQR